MNKAVKRYQRIVNKINKLEKEISQLADKDFLTKTKEFKQRLAKGEKLKNIVGEAYALVREAARRKLGLRAYDVQIMGALAVNEEKITEMKTGEGKTLTIIFPAYLNALTGEGVHVITANDYLAERDATELKPVYEFLGLSVDYITSKTKLFDRQVAYQADVTYATNNEIGFDFLRDNMLYDPQNKRQRGFNFAIIDEADSVLIDAAQIPLVISDQEKKGESVEDIYRRLNPIIAQLKEGVDYIVNVKKQTVSLTPMGLNKIEKALGVGNIYQNDDEDYIYYVTRLLKAHALFKKDRDYIVDDGQIVIIDEFTGRLMYNHRYHQGIHQALEAKEGLTIHTDNKVLASITFQHLFRKYKKMAGLTGTAWTARKEFRLLYEKEVVCIPTNKPIRRVDKPDRFFLKWEDKMEYLLWTTEEYYFKGGAILIGTRSVKKSREVYERLLSVNIPAQVLNAKHTRREAEIIAQAGQPQTVTVATNMAGRGTDIKLADSVREKMGLVVLGTERHNARRIDNQLIGRAGRQGDPGVSQFLISAEDTLIKMYVEEEYLKTIRRFTDLKKGVEDKSLQKISDHAQKKMESILFDQRVLNYEFDKVLDKQRDSFYRQRNRVLFDRDWSEETLDLIKQEIYRLLLSKERQYPKNEQRQKRDTLAEIQALINNAEFNHLLSKEIDQGLLEKSLDKFFQTTLAIVQKYLNLLQKKLGKKKVLLTEKTVTLKVLDLMWAQHLARVEEIQEAALLASVTQGDFFTEYEKKMAEAYRELLLLIPQVVVKTLFRTFNRLLLNDLNSA